VFISSNGTSDWQPLIGYSAEWQNLLSEKIEELLYLSGVTSLDQGGIPTRFGSSIIYPAEVENVVIRETESDVYSPSPALLLDGERLSFFTEGLKILKKIMPKAEYHIVLSRRRKTVMSRIEENLRPDEAVKLYFVKPKYPQHMDEVIVPTILKGKFPYGFSAANIGVTVLSFQTVLHVYEAIAEGKPLIERIIALGGPGFCDNPHVKVRLGTPFSEIIKGKITAEKELRFIHNSTNTGPAIQDLSIPVTKESTALIALHERKTGEVLSFARPGFKKDSFSNTFLSRFLPFKRDAHTNIRGERRACLSCTFCADICPTGLMPNVLHPYIERKIIDETLNRYKIFDCIDCNLCTYVCPSKIPVAKLLHDGKEQLRKDGIDNRDKIASLFNLKGIEKT
ncbi:MAG: 4Fe-4S dicluster domain-containing protein, partial [Spirochaetota bacterium]